MFKRNLLTQTCLAPLMAVLVAWGMLTLAGCVTSRETQAPADAGAVDAQDAQEQDAATDDQDTYGSTADTAEGAEGDGEEGAVEMDFPDECLDRHGDVTAYAVVELTGEQLGALLEQSNYEWSERSQLWVKMDGSSALVVYDVAGSPLSRDAIAKLQMGAIEQAVSYRLVSGGYSSAKRALDGLACRVLDTVDVEYLDEGGVAVLTTPSQQRCLAFVCKSNDAYTVSVYSELAVANGLFSREARQELGTSVDEVFEVLTGRLPGADAA